MKKKINASANATRKLSETDARAELAAGRALPLAWLWLLGDARIVDTNPHERGRTMKLKVEDAKPQGQ